MSNNPIQLEDEIRHRYNRQTCLFLRIKEAALFISLFDLFTSVFALYASIYLSGRSPRMEMDLTRKSVVYYRPFLGRFDVHPSSSSNLALENRAYFSSGHFLKQILERRRTAHPPMKTDDQMYPTPNDLLAMRWIRFLTEQNECMIFFIVVMSIILNLLFIRGVLTNKPVYMLPYFIKKFLEMGLFLIVTLFFYVLLPDGNILVNVQPNFPLKNHLLKLDRQNLQLLIFSFLLLTGLIKFFITAVIWYCYKYVKALRMARMIDIITVKKDYSSITSSPPKYEEAMQNQWQMSNNSRPPAYTPLISS